MKMAIYNIKRNNYNQDDEDDIVRRIKVVPIDDLQKETGTWFASFDKKQELADVNREIVINADKDKPIQANVFKEKKKSKKLDVPKGVKLGEINPVDREWEWELEGYFEYPTISSKDMFILNNTFTPKLISKDNNNNKSSTPYTFAYCAQNPVAQNTKSERYKLKIIADAVKPVSQILNRSKKNTDQFYLQGLFNLYHLEQSMFFPADSRLIQSKVNLIRSNNDEWHLLSGIIPLFEGIVYNNDLLRFDLMGIEGEDVPVSEIPAEVAAIGGGIAALGTGIAAAVSIGIVVPPLGVITAIGAAVSGVGPALIMKIPGKKAELIGSYQESIYVKPGINWQKLRLLHLENKTQNTGIMLPYPGYMLRLKIETKVL